jgi:hypothetical protein
MDRVNVLPQSKGRAADAAARSYFQKKQMNTVEQVLKAVRDKPKWPSQCSIPGLSDFDPTHQYEKLKLFEEMAAKGFLTRVPGKTGVRTGLGFGITEKGEAELTLLKRHPE